MDEFDIPIFKKSYELYKELDFYIINFPKQHKYSLGQKIEITAIEFLEEIFRASQVKKQEKAPFLRIASVKLNLLRLFVRLAKDVRALDMKGYLKLQVIIEEIGRMLGGWLKSLAT